MDKFANNIKNLLEACTPYAWILPIIGFAIVGIALAIPSDKTKEFAKSHWASVIIGTIIVCGCVYLGDWVFKKISF
ncbi:hypothetical protein MT487_09540 [Lachnospiraceae bacterium NSJ-171]|nr:hypothetical protein [Lachnospiraceae bacterium NSJ-171]